MRGEWRSFQGSPPIKVAILLATEAQRTQRTAETQVNGQRNGNHGESTESANELGRGMERRGAQRRKTRAGWRPEGAGDNGLGTAAEAVSSKSGYHLFGR